MHQDRGPESDVDLEKLLMELLPAAICVVDRSGRIVRYNRRATDLWGRDPDAAAVDTRFTGALRLLTPDGSHIPEDQAPLAVALREGRSQKDVPIIIEQPGGRRLDILYTAIPLADAQGRTIGAISCFFDVTPLRRAEAEVRQLKDELEERVTARTRELARRMEQMSDLADLAKDVIAAASKENLLEVLCRGARRPLRAQMAISCLKPASGPPDFLAKTSPPLKLWPGRPALDPAVLCRAVFKERALLIRPRPLSREEGNILNAIVGGPFSGAEPSPDFFIIPIRVAPGQPVGFVLLIGGVGPTFQPGDEAIALQVSRIASIGLERLRAEQATEAARGELREFSYAVAHNLRAPLRALSGFSTMLVEDYQGRLLDEPGVKLLGRMNEAARRMDSLIQALLSYTRLTHEEFPLGPLPLHTVIEEAIGKAKAAIIAGDVTVKCDSVAFTVLGHPFLLGEALRHLLENAIKYTRRDHTASVAVRGEERGDLVRLWVEDHGPGIAPEHRERIFWLFELLTPEDAASGIGVGLPIVRKAVERMRGRYGVESEIGVGSRFWIELRRLPRSD